MSEVEHTVIITATFPANLPANQKVPAQIVLDPGLGAVNVQPVPSTEAWVVEDIFVVSSQAVDAILTFYKNLSEVAFKTAPINTLLVSNPSRPRITPFLYEPNSLITIDAQNLAAIGTSAVTITVYAKLRRFK